MTRPELPGRSRWCRPGGAGRSPSSSPAWCRDGGRGASASAEPWRCSRGRPSRRTAPPLPAGPASCARPDGCGTSTCCCPRSARSSSPTRRVPARPHWDEDSRCALLNRVECVLRDEHGPGPDERCDLELTRRQDDDLLEIPERLRDVLLVVRDDDERKLLAPAAE